jgi:microcystin-dependent protein
LPLDDYRVPAGAVFAFAGNTLPAGGYLWADGSAVSRTTYNDLYTAITTIYGAGDGVNTFNLPNTAGRVLAGKEATPTLLTVAGCGIDGSVVAATGGGQQNAATTNSTGSASGSIYVGGNTSGGINGTAVYASGGGGVATGYDVYYSWGGTFGATLSASVSGTSNPFSVVQPTMIMRFVIKT